MTGCWQTRSLLRVGVLGLLSAFCMTGAQAQNLRGRWLEVRQISGTVTLTGSTNRPARVGDQLNAVGQGLRTGTQSNAILAIDDGIGFVQVSENTDLQIQTLNVVGNGGKITDLKVNRGQARLNVRRLNNPNSRLTITTPAGVAAVRGTEFGLTISETGRSAIATQSGLVDISAQQQTETILPTQFSTVVPGQPPTPPRVYNPNLFLTVSSIVPAGPNQLTFTAQTDPPNLVIVNNREAIVDDNGYVQATVLRPSNRQLTIQVRGPLGNEKVYSYQLP